VSNQITESPQISKQTNQIILSEIITIEPGKRGGKPCIRHMRITIADVLGWLGLGMTRQQILEDFPELTARGYPSLSAFLRES
jgi:uncharacterized protein (DUF433 family)